MCGVGERGSMACAVALSAVTGVGAVAGGFDLVIFATPPGGVIPGGGEWINSTCQGAVFGNVEGELVWCEPVVQRGYCSGSRL